MPYKNTHDIPEAVRKHVPLHAQKIYLKAFNNAWEEYANPTKRRGGKSESREEIAHMVAWSAVKKKYRKKGQEWVLAK